MPGDRGFDPMGLSANKEAAGWYRQAEIVHARWVRPHNDYMSIHIQCRWYFISLPDVFIIIFPALTYVIVSLYYIIT